MSVLSLVDDRKVNKYTVKLFNYGMPTVIPKACSTINDNKCSNKIFTKSQYAPNTTFQLI